MDMLGCGDGGMEMMMVDVLMMLKVVGLGLLYWSLRVRGRIQGRMRSCEPKTNKCLRCLPQIAQPLCAYIVHANGYSKPLKLLF